MRNKNFTLQIRMQVANRFVFGLLKSAPQQKRIKDGAKGIVNQINDLSCLSCQIFISMISNNLLEIYMENFRHWYVLLLQFFVLFFEHAFTKMLSLVAKTHATRMFFMVECDSRGDSFPYVYFANRIELEIKKN